MKINRFSILALCIATMMFFAACFNPAPAAQPDPPAADDPPPVTQDDTSDEDVETPQEDDAAPQEYPAPAPDDDEVITLTFWDRNLPIHQDFVDLFMEENPNVIIEYTAFQSEDLRNIIRPALASGEGPDFFQYNGGAGYLGVVAKAGLALDITDIANERGWFDRHIGWTLDQCIFGGRLYGIGNRVETLGVFYNKAMFAEAGVSVPHTYDEFLEVLRTFRAQGTTPLIIDTLDRWPGFHLESMWLTAGVGGDAIREVLALRAGWDQPEFGAALDMLYELVRDGYTVPSPNSISYDDANAMFMGGEIPMRPTGGWMIRQFQDPEHGLGEDAGFFFLPPIDGVPVSSPSGIACAYVISSTANHVDTIADFLDFIFTGDRIPIWFRDGYIPSLYGLDVWSFEISPLFAEYAELLIYTEIASFNIDVLVPLRTNQITMDYMQELLAGVTTGLEAMEQKQRVFQEEVEAGYFEAME